jgi:hypothetical protein
MNSKMSKLIRKYCSIRGLDYHQAKATFEESGAKEKEDFKQEMVKAIKWDKVVSKHK